MELAGVLDHSAHCSWPVMEKPRAGEVRELNDAPRTDGDRSCGALEGTTCRSSPCPHWLVPRPLR